MEIKELKKIVTGFTKGLLGKGSATSKCYMVCFPLQAYLTFIGVETELINGEVNSEKHTWGHFWLRLKDGTIIDPTCDQFNIEGGLKMPKIYIGKLPDAYSIPSA